MGIISLVNFNLDLLSVGVAIAGTLILGSIIYLNNKNSITNRTFFYFSILTAVWGISNYLEYRFTTITATLWALRIHLFISTVHALLFFRLAYVFPYEQMVFPRWYRYILIPVVATVMIAVLTPLVFSGVSTLAPVGQVTRATPGPGIVLFILVAFGLLFMGLGVLLKRTWQAASTRRRQSLMLFIGMFLMAALILTFNVILPNVFAERSYIPFAALFILPFVAFTSYAVYRHHLFNLKVATTAVLGFAVTIFSFVNIVYSTSTSAIIINVTAFVIVLIGSIKIVQDTLALQVLAEELQETNARQETLIHFIGHEVKGFLTKDAGVFAALIDGDFGEVSEVVKPFVSRALAESRHGASSVESILKASNLKKGTVTFDKKPFDLKALVTDVVEKARSMAEQKGLALTLAIDDGDYTYVGDQAEMGDHVLRNLIENSINYTPTGSVTVSLKREGSKVIFVLRDTGVGITSEDKMRLFTEGGHGKDSMKINAHSTGYGLFIAKSIVEAHGGTIRAESEGAGKGATFVVELPS